MKIPCSQIQQIKAKLKQNQRETSVVNYIFKGLKRPYMVTMFRTSHVC